VLISSTEHFGGLINLDFDYKKYLATLASHNFTLTQTWTGAYVEPDADVGSFNTLDPLPASYIAPWARSDQAGNKKGGNKFDLTKFNNTFFERLVSFCAEAERHHIVVELGLFGGYEQTHESIFEYTPFYPGNNVNIPNGTVNRTTVFSMEAPEVLLHAQQALVQEIVKHVYSYDNVYFQLVSVGTSKMPGATPEWGRFIERILRDVDQYRMIAVPVEWSSAFNKPTDDNVVYNFGAAAGPMDIVPPTGTSELYPFHPLAYDESGGKPVVGAVDAYRQSYWQWMCAGGAVVDNLDWSFMANGYEDGSLPADKCHETGNSSPLQRSYISILAGFFSDVALDFVHMTPDGGGGSWLKGLGTSAAECLLLDAESFPADAPRHPGETIVLAAGILTSGADANPLTTLQLNRAVLRHKHGCVDEDGDFRVKWTDTLTGVEIAVTAGLSHTSEPGDRDHDHDQCTSSVSWRAGVQVHDIHPAGDLENRAHGTAGECATWCCGTSACVAFFHTVDQLSDAGNCSAGSSCCWLKPTFNTTRLDDFCSPPENCLSGNVSHSPTPTPVPAPTPAPVWTAVPIPPYTKDTAFKVTCTRRG
jgi:hypothetical protein